MNLQRSFVVTIGAIMLATAGLVNQAVAFPHPPGVVVYGPSVSINVPLPPAIVFPAPPQLVVVPGTNVYFAPDVSADVLFYGGYWWRSYEGRWYRGRSYRGPWHHTVRGGVPSAIYRLPRGYRHSYSHNPRLHHQEVERNWHRWQRDHHWQRDYHHDRRDYHRERYH